MPGWSQICQNKSSFWPFHSVCFVKRCSVAYMIILLPVTNSPLHCLFWILFDVIRPVNAPGRYAFECKENKSHHDCSEYLVSVSALMSFHKFYTLNVCQAERKCAQAHEIFTKTSKFINHYHPKVVYCMRSETGLIDRLIDSFILFQERLYHVITTQKRMSAIKWWLWTFL